MQRLCKYVECFLHLQKSSPSPSAGFLGTQPMNLSAPEREHKKVNYCHPPIYPSCYPFSQHIYSDAAFILHPVLIYPLLSNPTFKTILIYYPPSPMSVCGLLVYVPVNVSVCISQPLINLKLSSHLPL